MINLYTCIKSVNIIGLGFFKKGINYYISNNEYEVYKKYFTLKKEFIYQGVTKASEL